MEVGRRMLQVCKVVMVTIISSSARVSVELWRWLRRIYSPSVMFAIYSENRERGAGEKRIEDLDFQRVLKPFYVSESANVLGISKL